MESHFQLQSNAKSSTDYIKEKAATSWMGKRGKKIHKVFAVESQYDPHRDKYVPIEQAAIKYSIPYPPIRQVFAY